MEPWVVVLLVVVAGLVALWLIIVLGGVAIAGAVFLFAFASEQGFVGLAVYIALWGLFFPVMLVVCIVIGLVAMWNEKQEERERDERRRLGYDD